MASGRPSICTFNMAIVASEMPPLPVVTFSVQNRAALTADWNLMACAILLAVAF